MHCKVSKVITTLVPRPMIVTLENVDLNQREVNTKCIRDGNDVTFEVDSSNISYKGHTADEDTNNFIIIRDKRKNKIKLIQVDHANVLPYIKRQQGTASAQTENASVADLNKQFGSKKTRRRTEQHERMKMDVEHVRENLEKTVADVEIEDRNLEVPHKEDENDNTYRPPINRNASSRDQVYVLETLLPKSVLDSLEEEATAILENDLEQYEIRPITKKNILHLRKSNPSNAVLKCEIILYVDCLLSFLVTPVKLLNKSYMACSYSLEANKHILDTFSVVSGSGRNRPLSMKDKCICYAMVLLILASDYSINGEDFSKEVRLGLKKIQEIGRVIGLSVSGSILTLKLPLPTPVIYTGPRKRR